MIEFKPTHKGLFLAVVPVYLDMTDQDCPMILERHWSLLPLMVLAEALFGVTVFLATLVNPDFEPMYPIRITGEISHGN